MPLFPARQPSAGMLMELMHSDVVGPINPTSYYKNKNFITFIDDASRFTVVHFMTKKEQTFVPFKEYHTFME